MYVRPLPEAYGSVNNMIHLGQTHKRIEALDFNLC